MAISHLLGAARLVTGSEVDAGLSAEEASAHALLALDTFGDTWDAGLLLFGLHLLTWVGCSTGREPLPGCSTSCWRWPVWTTSSTPWEPC